MKEVVEALNFYIKNKFNDTGHFILRKELKTASEKFKGLKIYIVTLYYNFSGKNYEVFKSQITDIITDETKDKADKRLSQEFIRNFIDWLSNNNLEEFINGNYTY